MGIAVLIMFGFLYLIPGIVAFERGHPNTAAVMVLNIFLGWTLVGWVMSLVWAVTHIKKSP